MVSIDLESILIILAAILLIIYARGKNPVWGGLTIGAVLGLLIVGYQLLSGIGFYGVIIIRLATYGVLIGFLADLSGKLVDKLRGKNQ
jgi:hypothetical protein